MKRGLVTLSIVAVFVIGVIVAWKLLGPSPAQAR